MSASISAEEQYMLELVNAARLDPRGAAADLGISLNKGLKAGTISARQKQALAFDSDLSQAAAGHSAWMLQADTFSHTGAGGSLPWDRIADAGYAGVTLGENIAFRGTTGSINLKRAVAMSHEDLFLSPGHRVNLLNGDFSEIGIGQEKGRFTSDGTTYNSSMITQDFGDAGHIFLTGVVYDDRDDDDFYSVGEGAASVAVTLDGTGAGASVPGTGGYSIRVRTDGRQVATITDGAKTAEFSIVFDGENIKVDYVNGKLLKSDHSLRLIDGAVHVALSGIDDSNATGNGANNRLTGNPGDNRLEGAGGRDRLAGGSGKDVLKGGSGDDWIDGGKHRDKLTGGRGEDSFFFSEALKKSHVDRIRDFEVGDDTIVLDSGVFTKLHAGELEERFFRQGAEAKDGSDRVIYDDRKGTLSYDRDGDGGRDAKLFARVDKHLDLGADDFLVV